VYAHRLKLRHRSGTWIIAAARGRLPPDVSGKFCALAPRGLSVNEDYFRLLQLHSLCIVQFDHSFGIEALRGTGEREDIAPARARSDLNTRDN
jgi:hypothetical protein